MHSISFVAVGSSLVISILSLPTRPFSNLKLVVKPVAWTGPGHKRRIDFGLCSHSIWPSSLFHFSSIADHLGVAYSFTGNPYSDGCRPPARRPLFEQDCERISSISHWFWNDSNFQTACSKGDVNLAWSLLSDIAETCLAGDEHALFHGPRRSASWEPKAPCPQHKAAKSPESFMLQASPFSQKTSSVVSSLGFPFT